MSVLFSGRDVIAQAQSGVGKTATFTTAVLQRLDEESSDCQALILAPTRELANQVSQSCPGTIYYSVTTVRTLRHFTIFYSIYSLTLLHYKVFHDLTTYQI